MADLREALLVFLRLPVPGEAKTRLIPRLGPEGAARVYRRVAEQALASARSLQRPGLARLAFVVPAGHSAEGREWIGPEFECHEQVCGDLGRRMLAAFEYAFFRGAQRAVIVGTDIPGLDRECMERAFEALRLHDAVLGPALDGGYYLLGLSRPRPATFHDIPWSAPNTAETTLSRLEADRCWTHLLPTLRDLDTPEDLDALSPDWPALLGF